MQKNTIDDAITAAFVADAYALGAHWVYDEEQLKTLPLNWEELNAPQAMWHKGKQKGDFTHYGDHGKWLYDCVQKNNRFDISLYVDYWREKMEEYTGYVDGSSRETLALLKQDPKTRKGSHSHDLSIIGRIAPLLLVSNSKESFLDHVQTFVSFTHNSEIVLEAARFFAAVLYDVGEGSSIEEALKRVHVPLLLQNGYRAAMHSKGENSFTAIRNFGPACGVEGGFEGVIHLLMTYDDYKEAMIANAKAGGDTAARAMVVGMIMGAAGKEVLESWKNGTNNL